MLVGVLGFVVFFWCHKWSAFPGKGIRVGVLDMIHPTVPCLCSSEIVPNSYEVTEYKNIKNIGETDPWHWIQSLFVHLKPVIPTLLYVSQCCRKTFFFQMSRMRFNAIWPTDNTFQMWGTHIQCSKDACNVKDNLYYFQICTGHNF